MTATGAVAGRARPGVLAGAALAVAGLAVGVTGLGGGPPRLRSANPVVVNTDRPGLNAHNSPEVAADPRSPNVVALADRIDTPQFSCTVWLSVTGGDSWKRLALPLPAEAPNCHQPDVAFDGRGRLLVVYTATGGRFNQPVGVWVQRFEGDAPSAAAVRVAPADAFHARMAADGDRVWVTWVQATGAADKPLGFPEAPGPVMVARSADAGATFSAPSVVSAAGLRVVQPTPVVAGDRLVVGALDLGGDVLDYEAGHGGVGGPPDEGRWRVVSWSSPDGGASFGPPSVVADGLAAPQRIIVNLAPAPGFAADPSRPGRLYAAWDAGRGDGRDVLLARSDDAGATWTAPVAVAARPQGQLLPGVGVAADGRVDVAYYDRAADPDDRMARVAVSSSFDGGRSFRTTTVPAPPFDSTIGFGSLQGIPLLGSRLAVLSEAGRALAFWSDTSAGSVDTNIQDLASAEVTVDGDSARPALVAAGGLLLGLGVGLGLAVGLRPRHRGPQEA